ncbi:FAD/NAD(P)-binding domain-containing protein [Rhizoclosmatium globosum]|uniref:FAD/NAD(P)-binding domain-containing protein n=1 Tax=Rhizoclosmatium globosum TaxID=329046 RepID=A0A1Y2CEM9_9FUNG|nr:FAD/NAD(P)-binding domain-containing protein [Rhizoclosmatium globosum]|eukprot:ORY45472.1 FAD/NAD(P)-binding domain-containing protein [Rhizoclosmatium globosum]
MHALIIGSGLVGVATALALHQIGIQCTLYDQVNLVEAAIASGGNPVAVDFGDSGGSVALMASALRVLRTLGVLDEVLASSFPAKITNWFKIDGSANVALDTINVNRRAGETDPLLQPPIQILRSKLHSILIQAAAKEESALSLARSSSASKRTRMGRQQTLKTARQPPAILSSARWRPLRSTRAIFGKDCKAEFTGVIGHIGVVRTRENGIHLKESCAFYLQREKKQMVCEEYRPVSDLPKESSRLADMIAQWGVPKHVESPTYHKGKVMLIGDAAHGMVPNAGIGLLTGIEDVGVIRELFSRFQDPQDISKVFTLYSQLRVPRGHDASKRSREMAKQYYSGSTNMGHFLLRVGIFLFNYNILTYYTIYDCPTEVASAISKFNGIC